MELLWPGHNAPTPATMASSLTSQLRKTETNASAAPLIHYENNSGNQLPAVWLPRCPTLPAHQPASERAPPMPVRSLSLPQLLPALLWSATRTRAQTRTLHAGGEYHRQLVWPASKRLNLSEAANRGGFVLENLEDRVQLGDLQEVLDALA